MGYEDTPKKKQEILDDHGGGRAGHDALIERAGDVGKYGERSDAYANGDGFLGVDDLDRIRRKNLKHKTR